MSTSPNVIWITLDSIRQDRCSYFGYEKETTPTLDHIARQGTAFSNCFAHGIWSLPSITSILTGTYPSYHQVGDRNETLPSHLKTVPERFSEVGYTTVGISANPWFSEATDLDRGFDDFTYLNKSSLFSGGIMNGVQFLLNLNDVSGGYTTEMAKHRSEFLSQGTIRSELQRLEHRDKPFFMYAHTEGAHTPYYPPKKYIDKFAIQDEIEGKVARDLTYEIHDRMYEEMAHGLEYSQDHQTALEAMYDALINFVDDQLGKVYKTIRECDLGETILIVTSDHGDLLGEMGVLSHKLCFHDGLIHVPTVVEGIDFDFNSDELVQHIDIIQNIMAQLGVNTENMQGVDLQQSPREAVLTQRGDSYYQKTMDKILKFNPGFDQDRFHSGFTHCIRNSTHKLVSNDHKDTLYDVKDESEPKKSQSHQSKLKKILKFELDRIGESQLSNGDSEFSDEMKSQLRDLGYI